MCVHARAPSCLPEFMCTKCMHVPRRLEGVRSQKPELKAVVSHPSVGS